ncbi:MAG TPA: hypothetical protein VG942_17815 [Hyphomonadaceae bacterium]|nr:hypothetical protein [Hyphomonadaceae bacterium]
MRAFGWLRRGLVAMAGLGLMAGAAHADPITVKSGKTLMPASGLSIDLPAQAGIEYHVSSSWSLFDNGSFDSRDIIDELNTSSNELAAGNWIVTGYFDAGGCDETLNGEKLGSAWTTELDLWGQHWKVKGGIYTFEGSTLGRKAAAVLCTTDAASGRSLLLYRFVLTKPETLPQADVLADVKSSTVLRQAWASYRDGKIVPVTPLKRPEVRNRGKIAAARTVTLTKAKLQLDLPDDGYVWLANYDDQGDILDRMAPSLPDVSVEVLVVPGKSCDEAFKLVPPDGRIERKATGLPAGWFTANALAMDEADELLTCHALGDEDLVLAGVVQPKGASADVSSLAPLLGALAKARPAP